MEKLGDGVHLKIPIKTSVQIGGEGSFNYQSFEATDVRVIGVSVTIQLDTPNEERFGEHAGSVQTIEVHGWEANFFPLLRAALERVQKRTEPW